MLLWYPWDPWCARQVTSYGGFGPSFGFCAWCLRHESWRPGPDGATGTHSTFQWPFWEPIDWRYLPYIRPIFQAYVREYPHKICPSMVQYLHFRILEFPLILGFLGCTTKYKNWMISQAIWNDMARSNWVYMAVFLHPCQPMPLELSICETTVVWFRRSRLRTAAGNFPSCIPTKICSVHRWLCNYWLQTYIPRCSMYGIFTYIWVIFRAHVGKYSIHGAYGNVSQSINWEIRS